MGLRGSLRWWGRESVRDIEQGTCFKQRTLQKDRGQNYHLLYNPRVGDSPKKEHSYETHVACL